jgi:hypothetical protein
MLYYTVYFTVYLHNTYIGINSFIRLLVYSFMHSFIYLLIKWFTHLFVFSWFFISLLLLLFFLIVYLYIYLFFIFFFPSLFIYECAVRGGFGLCLCLNWWPGMAAGTFRTRRSGFAICTAAPWPWPEIDQMWVEINIVTLSNINQSNE